MAKLPSTDGAPEHLDPPWLICPDVPRYSIGWRMGSLEQSKNEFADWFVGLGNEEKAQFRKDYPEPPEWAGYYDLIEHRLTKKQQS